MRYDKLYTFRDRFGRTFRRHGEARHNTTHLGGAFAEQQADVVPFRGQRGRGYVVQKCRNGGNSRHMLVRARPTNRIRDEAVFAPLLRGRASLDVSLPRRFRRELVQLVDAKLLFEGRHLIDRLLKKPFAETALFLFLHLLIYLIELLFGNDFV